jgi:hypothetical protein
VPSLPTRPSRVPDLMGKAVKTGEYLGRVPRERARVGGLPSHSSRAPLPNMLLSGDESSCTGLLFSRGQTWLSG